MRGRTFVATLTLVAFTTLVIWPRGAAADDKPAEAKAAPAAAPAPASTPAAPASEDGTMAQAKQHFETGRNAYNAGDYVTAIREFKAAEALRPSPILDYNIGLANEKLGKRRVAVKYYRRYLDAQPNASNKAEVEGKVSTLEAEIAASPPPAAMATPGGTAGQPQAQEQPGDMPPPAAGVAQAQPGYDPYGSQPPPGQPMVKPAKKKSYWWVGLIIAGGVALTIGLIVLVVVVGSGTTTTTTFDHALTAPPPRVDRSHDLNGVTLLRF